MRTLTRLQKLESRLPKVRQIPFLARNDITGLYRVEHFEYRGNPINITSSYQQLLDHARMLCGIINQPPGVQRHISDFED